MSHHKRVHSCSGSSSSGGGSSNMITPIVGSPHGGSHSKQHIGFPKHLCLPTIMVVAAFYQLMIRPQWHAPPSGIAGRHRQTVRMMAPATTSEVPEATARILLRGSKEADNVETIGIEHMLLEMAEAAYTNHNGHDTEETKQGHGASTKVSSSQDAVDGEVLQDIQQAMTIEHQQMENSASIDDGKNHGDDQSASTKVSSSPVASDGDKETDAFDFNTTQGISACLLIKDDNHWVVEWLAYHWFVLPLRHLVVAIDPASKTSPRKILDRWKGLMRINVWEENVFVKPISASTRALFGNNTELMYHRNRQNSFYTKCQRYFQKKHNHWLLLIDTDEFMSLDYRGLREHPKPLLQDMAERFPIQTPGSVLQALKYHQNETGEVQKCVHLERNQVGAREANATLVGRYLPMVTGNESNGLLNPQDFLTQRFLYETEDPIRLGKNLMHLTGVYMVKANPDVHRVSHHCPTSRLISFESTAFFKLRHYLGTQEQFMFRSDPRAAAKTGPTKQGANYDERNLDAYFMRGEGADYLDTDSQGWIEGFIQQVGLAKAKKLLQGVGQVGFE